MADARGDALALGIDCSTTAAKAVVVDAQGGVRASGRAGFALANPAPDGWEQDARDWLRATLDAVRAAVGALAPGDRARIGALAIAHQRETFVLTDPAGEPLAPALVWMDARCRPEVAQAARELDPGEVHRVSGKPACVTPSLYKLRFLLERHRPALRARDKRVLDVHAYLAWHLTGELATSTAAADPLGLVDLAAGAWSAPLCDLARVRLSELPRLVRPGSELGTLRTEVAESIGLPAGLPVVAGAGDGQAAGLGAGVCDEGAAYVNLGTAVVAGVPSRALRIDRAFRTLFAADGAGYLLETDLKGGTFTLDWLADRVLGDGALAGNSEARARRLSELEARARAVPAGADGLLALPYWAGVMNPFWNDDATGALVGLRGDHGPEHLYRAVCEGIAFELRRHLEAVAQVTGPLRTLVAVGGGARSALFGGVVASVLGRPLARAGSDETTALGAAMLAAVRAGMHPDVASAARAMARAGEGGAIEPGPDATAYDAIYREAYVGLYEALAPRMAALVRLRGG